MTDAFLRKPRTLWLAGLLASLGLSAASAETLEVSLQGVQHGRGTLHVDLFNEPDSFRKEARALRVVQVPARPGTVQVEFRDLAPGRYAVMAYHDEDGNGELNRRFGMFPLEGYGLSGNPQVIGPPGFRDSAFHVSSGQETRISLEMRY